MHSSKTKKVIAAIIIDKNKVLIAPACQAR